MIDVIHAVQFLNTCNEITSHYQAQHINYKCGWVDNQWQHVVWVAKTTLTQSKQCVCSSLIDIYIKKICNLIWF